MEYGHGSDLSRSLSTGTCQVSIATCRYELKHGFHSGRVLDFVTLINIMMMIMFQIKFSTFGMRNPAGDGCRGPAWWEDGRTKRDGKVCQPPKSADFEVPTIRSKRSRYEVQGYA